jgi:hypothetical protein
MSEQSMARLYAWVAALICLAFWSVVIWSICK